MDKISILLGKSVQALTRLRGNGGSALPGLIVEKTNPAFLRQVLKKLPYGVVVVSGTNGKTTTTKIVSELLEKQGLRVFTNASGSNFVRGVISSILEHINLHGTFDYDIAVLELDEAHAVKFAAIAPISHTLLLNVERDQLDRFGEIDHTAKLLNQVAHATTSTVILNREDPRLREIQTVSTRYFGLSNKLLRAFPSDDDLLDQTKNAPKRKLAQRADVTLISLRGNRALYQIAQKKYTCTLALKGVYNAFNAAGALALVRAILPESKPDKLIKGLTDINSAFGRGESFIKNGAKVELFLVKNPSAFQLNLTSFADKKHHYLIAINDQIADGRDVSWLWNVDFRSLPRVAYVSGTRATDMALRLKYDEVPCAHIEADLSRALSRFLAENSKPKRIFATYTAMLAIRKILAGRSIL